jgi:polysaccharide export outer membrane protein
MTHPRFRIGVHFALSLSCAALAWAAPQDAPPTALAPALAAEVDYVLGSDDVIAIQALHAEEVGGSAIRIDPDGQISLPLIGRLTAAGLTIEELEQALVARLKTYVHDPTVAVTVVQYRSQPVSVIGAVGVSGVHQLEGRKTLIEILATAGGLRPEAGDVVKITRKAEWGPIPLASAMVDPTGQFSIAEVSLTGIIKATNPEQNIRILPNDVISVPRAALVYVIGEVKRPGGFVLNERRTISGLHALAMAQGFSGTASPNRAVIIRQTSGGERVEIAANLKAILEGKTSDVELLPDDILFVPNNAARTVLGRTLQTALSAVTSATIYRGF